MHSILLTNGRPSCVHPCVLFLFIAGQAALQLCTHAPPCGCRYKEFQRNLRREYARLVALLQAYALVATGVRLIATNQAGGGARTTVVSTQGGADIR